MLLFLVMWHFCDIAVHMQMTFETEVKLYQVEYEIYYSNISSLVISFKISSMIYLKNFLSKIKIYQHYLFLNLKLLLLQQTGNIDSNLQWNKNRKHNSKRWKKLKSSNSWQISYYFNILKILIYNRFKIPQPHYQQKYKIICSHGIFVDQFGITWRKVVTNLDSGMTRMILGHLPIETTIGKNCLYS